MFGTVNIVLQKNRRSAPFTVHIDKLKPVYDKTPEFWPLEELGIQGEGASAPMAEAADEHDLGPAQVDLSSGPGAEKSRGVGGCRRKRAKGEHGVVQEVRLPLVPSVLPMVSGIIGSTDIVVDDRPGACFDVDPRPPFRYNLRKRNNTQTHNDNINHIVADCSGDVLGTGGSSVGRE